MLDRKKQVDPNIAVNLSERILLMNYSIQISLGAMKENHFKLSREAEPRSRETHARFVLLKLCRTSLFLFCIV